VSPCDRTERHTAALAGTGGTAPRLHGPYRQWTRKKDGKTATRILSDDQFRRLRPWFDNHRRLRELVTELETLSLAIAEADSRWNR
jgi:hypothetical protein